MPTAQNEGCRVSLEPGRHRKCPDCRYCLECSKNRCSLCRRGAHEKGAAELGTGFTHGQYLEWKRSKAI